MIHLVLHVLTGPETPTSSQEIFSFQNHEAVVFLEISVVFLIRPAAGNVGYVGVVGLTAGNAGDLADDTAGVIIVLGVLAPALYPVQLVLI